MAFEYFDIPYRYNETKIYLLFQTPLMLFAFWDISDNDENKYIEKFGKDSYFNSKIYLKITNETNGKVFNVDINPFAKNWYIQIQEPYCKYRAEVCRSIKNHEISMASSNTLNTPNNKIIMPKQNLKFVNIKNQKTEFVITINDYEKQIKQYAGENASTNGDVYNSSYLLSNPSSQNNISSGTRYFNKEDSNG